MGEYRYCKRCGMGFQSKREDHFFCSAKCVAAWYRENPNPDYIHAEKDHIHEHYCEECGSPFSVNDYAQRGGQRIPKYCSVRCKQAAYRARMKYSQPQAQRRQRKNANGQQQQQQQHNARSDGQQRKNANSGHSGANSGHSTSQSDFWKGYQTKWAAAEAILGVPHGVSDRQLQTAYRALVKRWHPDLNNNSEESTIMIKKINWAYEYMTKK